MRTKTNIEYVNGPYDGWVVDLDPQFKKHYYAPIVDDRYHHYERIDNTYVYRGEVAIVK